MTDMWNKTWPLRVRVVGLLTLFFIILFSGSLRAEVLGYSESQLQDFWQQNVGNDIPLQDYLDTLNQMSVTEPDEPDSPPCPNPKFCMRGLVVSSEFAFSTESLQQSVDGQPYLFRAYELSETMMSTSTNRRLMLNMFLMKTQQFKIPVVTENSDSTGEVIIEEIIPDYPALTQNLLKLVYRAHAELFFIELLDYVRTTELAGKCQHIRKSDRHYQFVSEADAAAGFENEDLRSAVNTIHLSFRADLEEKLTCRAVPLADDNQLEKMIEKSVDCQVSQQLWLGSHCNSDMTDSEPGTGAILKTIVEGMNSEHSALGSLESTLDSVQLNTLSGNLFELEREVTNFSDNLDFLMGDMLGLKGTTQEMVDKVTEINQLPDASHPPAEVENLTEITNQLRGSVSDLLSYLKLELGTALPNSSCGAIDPQVHEIFLQLNCAGSSTTTQCSNYSTGADHCFCRCLSEVATQLGAGGQLDFQPDVEQLSADIQRIDAVLTPQN